jgi:iron complex outermembrane recepter protein
MHKKRQGLPGGLKVFVMTGLATTGVGPVLADETGQEVVTLQEVVVTAQKRTESLMDVPMALTALTGEDLTRDHATRFEDYVGQVPGLNLIESSQVTNQLVIRGITVGASSINSTVAVYVDETPWTSEGPFANPGLAPNLDTYDMQRIEVLRGPQGTLYGAIALGGLVKFVTNAPDPSQFAASVEAGGSSVSGGGAGYDFHGMINVPIAQELAFRLVAYDNYYPGYIDDPSRGVTNINGSHVTGGRAALLFAPTDQLSVRLTAIFQQTNVGDSNNVDLHPGSLAPVYGNWQQRRLISSPQQARNELYNATIDWDAGPVSLVSSTSYSRAPFGETQDASDTYGPFFSPYGVAVVVSEPVTNLTQEVRLSSPKDNGPLQWQVGGYYNHEFANEYEQLFLVDPATREVLYNNPLSLGTYHIEPTFTELAGFTNLDYFIVPTFDVAAGARYSSNRQTYSQVSDGLLSGTTDFVTPSSDHSITYSGDARWHWTPQTMLYVRIATGYAPGGPNDSLPGSTLPQEYKSSRTRNYEVGLKTLLLDDRVSAEVSIFQIDWNDIQTESVVGALAGITNGGKAKSDGVEWNFGYVPLSGLKMNLSGAYTHARLLDALPSPSVGVPGDLLPDVPEWSTNFGADYERGLFADYRGFVGASWRYSDTREAEFPSVGGGRQRMPSYNMIDLRAGIDKDRWGVTLYVKNVANAMVFSAVSPLTLAGGAGTQTATTLPPRTVGIAVSAKF